MNFIDFLLVRSKGVSFWIRLVEIESSFLVICLWILCQNSLSFNMYGPLLNHRFLWIVYEIHLKSSLKKWKILLGNKLWKSIELMNLIWIHIKDTLKHINLKKFFDLKGCVWPQCVNLCVVLCVTLCRIPCFCNNFFNPLYYTMLCLMLCVMLWFVCCCVLCYAVWEAACADVWKAMCDAVCGAMPNVMLCVVQCVMLCCKWSWVRNSTEEWNEVNEGWWKGERMRRIRL